VDATKSTKNIPVTSPPTDDGAVYVGATPADKGTKINAAADDQSPKRTAVAPSLAVGVQNISTADPPADGVVKLATIIAKKTTSADTLDESTGKFSLTVRPKKKKSKR
jgi:hypothetical protein